MKKKMSGKAGKLYWSSTVLVSNEGRKEGKLKENKNTVHLSHQQQNKT